VTQQAAPLQGARTFGRRARWSTPLQLRAAERAAQARVPVLARAHNRWRRRAGHLPWSRQIGAPYSGCCPESSISCPYFFLFSPISRP